MYLSQYDIFTFFSRLDRLLKLIDTAQSPAYRRLAAKQLGALVQSQPNQARPLLKMVKLIIVNTMR